MRMPEGLPKVVAVVLNYNGLEDTIRCVDSLIHCGYENLEIIIVDNASPDGSGKILREHFPAIPFIAEPTNTGYAGGNNAGIRRALAMSAENILITNNDVIVEPGFLQPLVDMLGRDSRIGVVNGKVFYQSKPDEVFSAAGEFSYLLCTGLNKSRKKALVASNTLECEVNYVCGVLMLVRREVFETLGELDEQYFMYFEDVEFSRRVLTRFRLGYTARSTAFHKSGGGKGWSSYTELYLYYHTRNRFLAFQKESMLYRVYVASYALANCFAKAVVIATGLSKDPTKVVQQWSALVRGYRDGILCFVPSFKWIRYDTKSAM